MSGSAVSAAAKRAKHEAGGPAKRAKQEAGDEAGRLLKRFMSKQGEYVIPYLTPSDLFGCGISAACREFNKIITDERIWRNVCFELWPSLLSVHIPHERLVSFREFYRTNTKPSTRGLVSERELRTMVMRSACALRYLRTTDVKQGVDINAFHALLPGHAREDITIENAACVQELDQHGVGANQTALFARMVCQYLSAASCLQIMSGPMSHVMLTRGLMMGLHYFWIKMIVQTALSIAKGHSLAYIPWFVHAHTDGRVNGMKVLMRNSEIDLEEIECVDPQTQAVHRWTVLSQPANPLSNVITPVLEGALISNHIIESRYVLSARRTSVTND
jgi:hypothetical protein